MKERKGLFWIAVIVLFLLFLFLIRSILLPFVLGAFTAYFLDPAADKLEKYGLSRSLSTLIITACFFVTIILISILIIPIVASQFSGLIAALPSYISDSEQKFIPLINSWMGDVGMLDADSIKTAVADFSGTLVKMAGAFIAGLFASGMAFVNLLSLFLITPVVAFYLLEDWDRITARVDSWLPRQHAATIRAQLAIIDRTLAGFVRGQFNVCIILATYYALALSLAGLHFSTVIGIGTGLLVIVPYAGWMLGATIGMGGAFFEFNSVSHICVIAGIFIVGMLVEGNFLTPRLVGKKVGLHPVWIIFGMLSGAALFGFVGVLLAVPATAVIGVLIRFAIERYLQSDYYRNTPAAK